MLRSVLLLLTLAACCGDEAAAFQGSIGYMVIVNNIGYPVGYTVTAMGRNVD